ncbi:hypothetical protein SETIT_9G381800v2 [Setaria italica]|uniref:Uncharacterized protein n=1 Tax=Setaria italica TaxID=4555 RepID=A0A368SQ27_SETIT|nr:hypothetical protein SETIT_9G381800v2 [Setaria italica]
MLHPNCGTSAERILLGNRARPGCRCQFVSHRHHDTLFMAAKITTHQVDAKRGEHQPCLVTPVGLVRAAPGDLAPETGVEARRARACTGSWRKRNAFEQKPPRLRTRGRPTRSHSHNPTRPASAGRCFGMGRGSPPRASPPVATTPVADGDAAAGTAATSAAAHPRAPI